MNKGIFKYLSQRAILHKEQLEPINSSLRLIIVIPAYRENRLDVVLEALLSCPCPSPESVEILVVLNRPASDAYADNNIRENESLIKRMSKNSSFTINYLSCVFDNPKKAGVGLARKTGMDLALSRLIEVNRPDGWIVCLDADCDVSADYLSKLLTLQQTESNAVAGSINFQHQIPDSGKRSAIYQYELHLRYYIEMQRRLGLPYAHHTIGSAMFVRASDYALKGGMNTRKAGEDFYFLHKFTLEDGFKDYNRPIVYPSARSSTRVPFGTGRAILDFDGQYKTYNPQSFTDLSQLLQWVRHQSRLADPSIGTEVLGQFSPAISNYLNKVDFVSKWQELIQNTSSYDSFMKRFYQWFNAFRLMKCLHDMRANGYPPRPVLEVAREVLKDDEIQKSEGDLLSIYRHKNTFNNS